MFTNGRYIDDKLTGGCGIKSLKIKGINRIFESVSYPFRGETGTAQKYERWQGDKNNAEICESLNAFSETLCSFHVGLEKGKNGEKCESLKNYGETLCV